MDAALDAALLSSLAVLDGPARAAGGADLDALAAPEGLALEPIPRELLKDLFEGGEPEADAYEEIVASAAKVRGALDVALAEGLHALRQRDRLTELGFHLDDYGREVLDLGKRTVETLAALGGALKTRPLLRDAMASGRVTLRAGEAVVPVAAGPDEARWVELAATETVRALEQSVRRARGREDAAEELDDEDDVWFRLRTGMTDDDRELFDAALALAGEATGSRSTVVRLEAMAQEVLATLAPVDDGEDPKEPGLEWRECGEREGPRRARLEDETERWSFLPRIAACVLPEVRFYETATAKAVDGQVRKLAKLRAGWEAVVAHCALALKRSRIPSMHGFSSFRHYVEERLRLPARAVEQRVLLEARVWDSPALREARRQRVSYEKLRVLSHLAEQEIASWIPRAKAWTCIRLSRAVTGEKARQMRARGMFSVSLPRRVAVVLAAAVETLRKAVGNGFLPISKCLRDMAAVFVLAWTPEKPPKRTRSREVRERDGGACLAPGCSHPGGHSHHVEFTSRGGSNDPENQIGACAFHHLRCIHGGFMTVVGRAPDALEWFVGGEPFTGGVELAGAEA